ncbi:acyltransferase family protein [Paenibacillus sp. YN15]|uniref:acyltransferase family protein n=1 Tax=Paenibacillus sp. YN15 TaxID=1742774 RepID=UPI000DCDD6A4|nr:acyltransferase family protein [Paenibacillus sp. YN15]RAU92477.1 hypothetical protein DQG13_27490 [Paenibacillus sp. YN15]
MIREVFFLRAIACLSIVLGHSISSSLNWYPFLGAESKLAVDVWRTVTELLLFGTPMFVFISALVLSHAYPKGTPQGFLLKRTKYILVPYFIMGVFYAALACAIEGAFATLPGKIWDHIVLGQFHGYFIVIIFQFYLLHTVFHKVIRTVPLKKLLLYSLLVNAGYLLAVAVLWKKAAFPVSVWWLPFSAWIFYYVLAYHVGQNLDWYRRKLSPYGLQLGIGSVVAAVAVLLSARTGIFPFGSKRVDVLVYTVLLCFFIFGLASRAKRVPRWLETVSSYSFGIYWLHVFFIAVLHKAFKFLPQGLREHSNLSLYILYLFITALLLSMAATYLLTRHPAGEFIVGKLGVRVSGKRGGNPAQGQNLTVAK